MEQGERGPRRGGPSDPCRAAGEQGRMRGEQGTESTSLMVSSAEDVSDRRDRSSGGRLPDMVRTRGEPQCSSQPLSTVWADFWNEPGQNQEQLTRQQAVLQSLNRSPLTSSLLVPSSWALSEGDRSKGVRPMLLQILLHRWEWKNKAMPLTPGGGDGAPSVHVSVPTLSSAQPYPGSRLQSRSPSPCGPAGQCTGPPPPGCPPRSAGVPTARR